MMDAACYISNSATVALSAGVVMQHLCMQRYVFCTRRVNAAVVAAAVQAVKQLACYF